jgi:hypothetical protein
MSESDRWQVTGFDSPTACALWMTAMYQRFKTTENHRTRMFTVSNDKLVDFLEANNVELH